MIGTMELVVIFSGLVLLFGANKLPKLGGAIGESIKNFKKGLEGEGDKEKIEKKSDDEKAS
jgi:sec-independent protein translocase protein TatA